MAATVSVAPAIAVVTHDSLADLGRFLDGQLDTAERLGGPLVVVDNASTDGTAERLRERAAAAEALELVEMGRNAGYSAAVNAAFAAAPGRDVLLVNPDVELSGPDPVRALAAILHSHPSVAVAGPCMVGELGEPQASARRFPSLLALLGNLPRIGGLDAVRASRARYEEPSLAECATVVDWVVGAAMMIRRRAFDAVGGWDCRYFLYVEDVDFCRRLRHAGWEVVFAPEVRLVHRFGRESEAANGRLLPTLPRRRHYVSHARLFASEPGLLFGRGRVAMRPLDRLGR